MGVNVILIASVCARRSVPVNERVGQALMRPAASGLALYLHRNEVMEGIYDSDI